MKYITIIELENNDCCNVGTISDSNIESKFKEAIESHFDAELLRYRFVNSMIFKNLNDCINGLPIEVVVVLDMDGDSVEYKVELTETWLY